MEESVALDSSKQKQFVKSVRGIKKLLKKKGTKTNKTDSIEQTKQNDEPKKPVPAIKKERSNLSKVKKSKKQIKRGLVYLCHIPHGFYEHEMTEYFKQFGGVTNVRVIRSKRTGNSKGYAFVEFQEPAVAEIVADTMNNYLMGKRLIKAVYIPPEKQKLYAKRKNWNFQQNPASEHRLKMKKALNADKSDKDELLIAKKLLSNLLATKEKLKAFGIDYDFFVPVDVPEALNKIVEKCKGEMKQTNSSITEESKEKIKVEDKVTEQKHIKSDPAEIKLTVKKENNKNKKNSQIKIDTKRNEKQLLKENKNISNNKNKTQETNNKQPILKIQKKTNVIEKELQNFININKSDDSDGTVDFDSDEFEKAMENDDDELSSADESDDFNDESNQKLDSIKRTKKAKTSVSTKALISSVKTTKDKQVKGEKKLPEKRKNISNIAVTTKKTKFEKQNKKTMNKVVKKKK